MLGLIGLGLWHFLTGSLPTFSPPPTWVARYHGLQELTSILLLRAFSLQFVTMFMLVLAANTSFVDFPRLASILARDRYFPHQFCYRGSD